MLPINVSYARKVDHLGQLKVHTRLFCVSFAQIKFYTALHIMIPQRAALGIIPAAPPSGL